LSLRECVHDCGRIHCDAVASMPEMASAVVPYVVGGGNYMFSFTFTTRYCMESCSRVSAACIDVRMDERIACLNDAFSADEYEAGHSESSVRANLFCHPSQGGRSNPSNPLPPPTGLYCFIALSLPLHINTHSNSQVLFFFNQPQFYSIEYYSQYVNY